MTLDTSAVLSLIFDEVHAQRLADHLAAAPVLQMSTVNLTECLIRLHNNNHPSTDAFVRQLTELPIDFVAPDRDQAELAAMARLHHPLNFGDCFAYALAKSQNLPLLTLDRDFRSTDVDVLLPES